MNAKTLLLGVALISANLLTIGVQKTAAQITTPAGASPQAQVSQTVGISTITVDYSRPAVNGREGSIWGKLIPYGFTVQGFGNNKPIPWRAGANENTVIEFSHDAKVEGQAIKAGAYGLHMALEENGDVTVIFSSNISSWGSYWYEEAEDVLRVKVKSEENHMTERLTFDFMKLSSTSATVVLDWEKKRIPFKVEFNTHDIVVANAQDELRGTAGFSFQGPMSAAQYCARNKTNLEQGLAWADQAIAMNSSFQTRSTKAQILMAMEKTAEAMKIMDEALADPTASVNDYYGYGRQLIGMDKDSEAMEIFKTLNKKWPKHWLAPHGLARAYSALGDFKKALKYEKAALAICPEGSKPYLEGYLKMLEEGKDFN